MALNVGCGARTVQMNPHEGQRRYWTNSVVSVTAGGSSVVQHKHAPSGGAASTSDWGESSVCIPFGTPIRRLSGAPSILLD
jgi:hypothetical protein